MAVHSLVPSYAARPIANRFAGNPYLIPGMQTNRGCVAPPVHLKKKSKIKNPQQKTTVEVKRIKEAVRFGQSANPNSIWGHIRHFDASHPRSGKVLGFMAIVAVSATVGFLADKLVDMIAHITERKNDKIGVLVGTVVGLLMIVTHGAWYFNFPKKLEMKYRCRDFHSDSKTPNGQARQLIEDRSLPLLMSMYNNAKSSCGVQHEHLIINNSDVFDALNYIAAYNISKDKWKNYLIEFTDSPPKNLPYFRANASVERVGIVAGNYYVSKWRTPNDILQRDLHFSYSKNYERVNHHFTEMLSLMHNFHKAAPSDPHAESALFLKQWNDMNDKFAQTKNNDINENAIAGKKIREAICNDSQIFSEIKEFIQNRSVVKKPATLNTPNETTTSVFDPASVSIHALEEHRPKLFLKLVSIIESSYKDASKWSNRSWCSTEELRQVGAILGGLKVAGIHTMLRNFIGPFIEGSSSAFGPMEQARSAGASIGMYIPMVCIGSAITVLGLGVSSTSPTSSLKTDKNGQTFPVMENTKNIHNQHRKGRSQQNVNSPTFPTYQSGLTSSSTGVLA